MMTMMTTITMMTNLSSRLESPTYHSFLHHLLHLRYILHFLRGSKSKQSPWCRIELHVTSQWKFPTRRFSYSPDSAVDDSFRPSLSSTLPFPRSNSIHYCGIPWSCTFCFFLLGSGSVVLNQYTSLTHPTPRYKIPSKPSVQLYVGPRCCSMFKTSIGDFSNKFPLFRSRSRSSRYEMEGGGDQQVNFLIRSRSH